MKVLALDIAKRQTGWAIGHADMELPLWGVFSTMGKDLPDWDGAEAEHVHR